MHDFHASDYLSGIETIRLLGGDANSIVSWVGFRTIGAKEGVLKEIAQRLQMIKLTLLGRAPGGLKARCRIWH